MSEIYGYVRVSTQEQNEERQLMELEKVGVPFRNIYMDKMSGKNFESHSLLTAISFFSSGKSPSAKFIWERAIYMVSLSA